MTFVPRLFEQVGQRVSIDHLGGLPLVSVDHADPRGWQFAVKYAIDRMVAGLALLVLSPILLSAILAVRLSLGRPIFFRQTRVGRDGRPFEMLKLRTMRPQQDGSNVVEPEWLPADVAPGGVEGVDRRTRVGAFLRRTCIDELPQLINVVRGEMSLIGPRPERPEYVALFAERIYRYGDRHRVKAGITGWAQVQRPARQDVPLRPGRVGQPLHRELVALARREDRAADVPVGLPHVPHDRVAVTVSQA